MTDHDPAPPVTHHHDWVLVSVDVEENGQCVRTFDCRGCSSINVTIA